MNSWKHVCVIFTNKSGCLIRSCGSSEPILWINSPSSIGGGTVQIAGIWGIGGGGAVRIAGIWGIGAEASWIPTMSSFKIPTIFNPSLIKSLKDWLSLASVSLIKSLKDWMSCSLASANAGGGTSEGSANAVSGMDAAAAASGMGAHARLSKIRT